MKKSDAYCGKIKEAAIKEKCWTCDCLQGFVTQLMIDAEKNGEETAELKKLLTDPRRLHSCLGCTPCPPGALFAAYVKKQKSGKG